VANRVPTDGESLVVSSISSLPGLPAVPRLSLQGSLMCTCQDCPPKKYLTGMLCAVFLGIAGEKERVLAPSALDSLMWRIKPCHALPPCFSQVISALNDSVSAPQMGT